MNNFVPTEQQIETLFKKLRNNEPLTDEDKAVNAIINEMFAKDIREAVEYGQSPEGQRQLKAAQEEKDRRDIEHWKEGERKLLKLNPRRYSTKEIELAEKNIRELWAYLIQPGAIVATIERQLKKWETYLSELVAMEDERTATEEQNPPSKRITDERRAVIPQTKEQCPERPKNYEQLTKPEGHHMFCALADAGILKPCKNGLQKWKKAGENVSTNDLLIVCKYAQDYLNLKTIKGNYWCPIKLFG